MAIRITGNYYNKKNNPELAKISLEKAFKLDTSDARVLMELDQLYKKLGISAEVRLAHLERYPDEVAYRDDLYLEKATLYNLTGNEKYALELIMKRQFHPWEGGEGKVVGQYLYAHMALAKRAIDQGDYQDAVDHLKLCYEYPQNLGEGKLFGSQENDINYWLGCAYDGLGETERAIEAWENAAVGLSEPGAAMYYNDQQPDKIFYQGLALLKLGREDKARSRFNKLLKYGEKHLFIPFKMDYFAVSLPDLLIFEEDLQKRHEIHCHYLMALGQLGLGNNEKAKAQFQKILSEDCYHIGAIFHQKLVG